MTERRDDAAPTGRRLPGALPPVAQAPSSPSAPAPSAAPGVAAPPVAPLAVASPVAVTPGAPTAESRTLRAVGAFALGTAAVLLGVAAAIVIALWPPPPVVDPSAVASGGMPQDVVAALASLRNEAREVVEIKHVPQPPPPRPADATVNLPEGHPYRAWALRCPSTSTPPPQTEGPITPGTQTTVLLPMVPPVRCEVSLAGPGTNRIDVRAGAHVTCRMAGGLVCD
jgi:hypothetical protein